MRTVKIVNLSRGTVVLRRAVVAATLWSRMRGLLGRAALPPGEGLLLRPANSIHTIGMRFAIDAAFVDRHGRVRLVIAPMPPGRWGALVCGAAYVIEAAAGEFARSGTVAGDRLALENEQ